MLTWVSVYIPPHHHPPPFEIKHSVLNKDSHIHEMCTKRLHRGGCGVYKRLHALGSGDALLFWIDCPFLRPWDWLCGPHDLSPLYPPRLDSAWSSRWSPARPTARRRTSRTRTGCATSRRASPCVWRVNPQPCCTTAAAAEETGRNQTSRESHHHMRLQCVKKGWAIQSRGVNPVRVFLPGRCPLSPP